MHTASCSIAMLSFSSCFVPLLQPTTSVPARMQWVVDLLVSKQTTAQAKPVGPKLQSVRLLIRSVGWVCVCVHIYIIYKAMLYGDR